MILRIAVLLSGLLQAGPDGVEQPKRKKIDLPDFPEGAAYVLSRLSSEELINVERSEPVHLAILTREGLEQSLRKQAIAELAKLRKTDSLTQILDGIARIDRDDAELPGAMGDLIGFLTASSPAELKKRRPILVKLATEAVRPGVRQAAYAALIIGDQAFESAWSLAEKTKNGLLDLLSGVPLIPNPKVRSSLYRSIKPLLHQAPSLEIREAAILASVALPGREKEIFAVLARFIREGSARDPAIEALLRLPTSSWPAGEVPGLSESVVKIATGADPKSRNTAEFKRCLRLGNELASLLPAKQATRLRTVLGGLGIRTVTLRTLPQLTLYDKAHLVAEAGRPVEITLENPDLMPHNLVIGAPGSLEEIGSAADRMAGDPWSQGGKAFVPKSEKVLYATPLVGPRKSISLTFVAPKAVGDYPYLCTYPGHWVRMKGILHVVEDVEAWIAANPDKAFGGGNPAMRFIKAWTLEDLVHDLDRLDGGDRLLDRGRELFTTASCVACHRVGKVGGVLGPDLNEVAKRLKPAEMLAQILAPSARIDEKYRTWILRTTDGRTLSGIIVERSAEALHLVEDPRKNSRPIEIRRDRIEAMRSSTLSTMPMGLLNTLTRDEILDLLAYVRSGQGSEE